MQGKLAIFIFMLGVSSCAQATCTLDNGYKRGTLAINATTIEIPADAPTTTTKAFKELLSNTTATNIRFISCEAGELYGRSLVGTYNTGPNSKIFETNIAGIYFILYDYFGGKDTNGNPVLNRYPVAGAPIFSGGGGAYQINSGAYYGIRFYKGKDKIKLTNPDGDTLLSGGDFAYQYLTADNINNHALKLNMGEIKLISTPACSVDSDKTVDFNTVTTQTLTSEGIDRDLSFSVNCKTDYGTYTAKAAIQSSDASSDSTYIKVKDAAQNMDKLGIKIYDSKNNNITVDGLTTEEITNVSGDTSATFKWKAKLIPLAGTGRPTNGNFTAQAQIILQLK